MNSLLKCTNLIQFWTERLSESGVKSGLNLENGVLHSTLHSNPTVGVECYLDCYHPQSKKWIGLTSGLHSKNNCGFGLWIALQKCRSVKCPDFELPSPPPSEDVVYVITFPTHTRNTSSSFWIWLLPDSATKVWSWITRIGGRMSVLLRSWGRDEISSEPKCVTYDWIINFPTYHTAWSISTKSVLQSTEESPGIPQMLLRWHKTYSNGWVVYRQRDTDLQGKAP